MTRIGLCSLAALAHASAPTPGMTSFKLLQMAKMAVGFPDPNNHGVELPRGDFMSNEEYPRVNCFWSVPNCNAGIRMVSGEWNELTHLSNKQSSPCSECDFCFGKE